MTLQISDEVRHVVAAHALAAVDGAGLFDPVDHAFSPKPLHTAFTLDFDYSWPRDA